MLSSVSVTVLLFFACMPYCIFRLYAITKSVFFPPCSHVPAIGRNLWPTLPSASVFFCSSSRLCYNQVRFFSPCSMCPPSAAACCSACRTAALAPPLSNPPPLLIGPLVPPRPRWGWTATTRSVSPATRWDTKGWQDIGVLIELWVACTSWFTTIIVGWWSQPAIWL